MALVLIATPDYALYQICDAEISGFGHAVLWAADGQAACEMAIAERPDLALLDVNLPVFNGFETCALLRNAPDLPSELPIILLSDDAVNPHAREKVAATLVFGKTHANDEMRELLAEQLGPDAGV